MAAWLTPDDPLVTELWPDAPSDETATVLIQSAQEQCEAYLFPQVATVPIKGRFKVALLMQARAQHRSLVAGGGDQLGGDGFTVTVWPMDRTVKALLRPPRVRSPR